MRITLLTTAAQGDTYPFLALAKRLATEGHQVRLAARPDFAQAAADHSVEFASVGHPYQPFLAGAAEANALASGHYLNKLRYGLRQRRYVTERLHDDAWQAVQGSDALIFKYSWPVGYSLAEKLQVPCVAAMLLPMSPTGAFPNFLVGKGVDRGPSINSVLWRATDQAWRRAMRIEDKRLRRGLLGLPPRPRRHPFPQHGPEATPLLYAYSPSVLARPPDWPENIHVTGYWFIDGTPRWQPPSDLLEFLDAGAPPVSIGFGSMIGHEPQATVETVGRALQLSGQRGVLLSGWGKVERDTLPDTVYCAEGLPHSWLFPRMAAVVHHGGAGTTGAGLRSGVPSVIAPFAADQFAWAKRVECLGAGPRPIPFTALTAGRLASAIDQAVHDKTMRAKAAEIARQITSEDGIGRAVEIIMNHVRQSSS